MGFKQGLIWTRNENSVNIFGEDIIGTVQSKIGGLLNVEKISKRISIKHGLCSIKSYHISRLRRSSVKL